LRNEGKYKEELLLKFIHFEHTVWSMAI